MPITDAFAYLRDQLRYYSLDSLADWAFRLLQQDKSEVEVLQALRDRPEFRTRFSSIFAREEAGLPALSPGEVVEYERQASQLGRVLNLPAGFLGRDRLQNLLANDVGLPELESRLTLYTEAAFRVPAEVRQQLKELYGIDEGGLAAFYADPDSAIELLQKQFMASRIAGSAQRQRFGQLTRQEAEQLTATTTPEGALEAFGILAEGGEILEALPGTTERAISRETQLEFVAGEQPAQERIRRRGRERESIFAQGGGFAAEREGITGIGLASR